MNSDQKNALLFLAVFAIGCMAWFWYVDHQRTTERVTNRLRPQIEEQLQNQVRRDNTLTLNYAEALFTNELIWNIRNNPEETTDGTCNEQLFENVFEMSDLRNTQYWKHENFSPRNAMVGSLDLLDIRTGDEFAERFKSSKTYEKIARLLNPEYPNWFDDLKSHVSEILLDSGRGYPDND